MANEHEKDVAPDARRLTEVNARRLLERAIQLDDARTSETSVDELRRVAEELNVSPAAFAEALRELEKNGISAPQAAAAPRDSEKPEHKRSWWRTVAIAIVGFVAGAFEIAPSGPWDLSNGIALERPLIGEPGPLLLLAASVYLMFYHRRRATPNEFQRDLLALWAGVGVGGFLAYGGPWPAALYLIGFGWLACSALGGFITRLKRGAIIP